MSTSNQMNTGGKQVGFQYKAEVNQPSGNDYILQFWTGGQSEKIL